MKNQRRWVAKAYERELARLEIEPVKLQGWIKHAGLKIAVIFEGRDSAGEMVLFDRSWYNRAGVERVMGFYTPEPLELPPRQDTEGYVHLDFSALNFVPATYP